MQALALKSQAEVVLFRAYHEPDGGAHPDACLAVESICHDDG